MAQTFQPYAVILDAEGGVPTFTAKDGSQKDVPTIINGMTGVAIGHDSDGDVRVIFDHRVETVAGFHLKEHDDPVRAQLWRDALWLEVNDEFEAAETYWRLIERINRRARVAVKECARCGEEKPLREFGFHEARRDGYRSECRACKRTEDAR